VINEEYWYFNAANHMIYLYAIIASLYM